VVALRRSRRARTRSAGLGVWRTARRYPLGTVGALVVACMVVLAAVPGWIAPHSPTEQAPSVALQSPSSSHRFGTDNFGRDVFSRVVYGTRSALVVGLGAVAVGLGCATVLGALSAYAGGWIDATVQRIVDALMALPWLVIAMSVLALVGPGRNATLVVIGVLTAPGLSRVVRSSVLRLRERAFVEAARTIGCPPLRILWRHLLPNIAGELVVLASLGVGGAMLSESALSFLGFGVTPPAPSWGYMLGVEGRRFLTTAPWLAIFPGAAIALAVFAATVLGDALRDALDPRHRPR
jgi:peptide/nickel transport system permease protein